MPTLTDDQRKAAEEMLTARPPVIEGTRVVPDDAARLDWYNKVFTRMHELALTDAQAAEFCDVAGVPD